MFGFIFDCDGTLVDSEIAHLTAWNLALGKRGKQLTAAHHLILPGQPYSAVLQVLNEDISLYHEKTKIYRQLQEQGMTPIERTVAFLNELLSQKKQLHLKIAIASAAPRHEIALNLRSLKLNEGIDAIISGQDDLAHYTDPEGVNKPKPYIYLHTAKVLGLAPEKCIAFEDSHTGVVAAKDAGLVTIALPNSHTQKHDFSKACHIFEPHTPLNPALFLKLIQ